MIRTALLSLTVLALLSFHLGCTTMPEIGSPAEVTIGTVSGVVTNAGNTGHNVQCWAIEAPYAQPGRWELSMQHGAEGPRGSFYLTAWTDTDANGYPDQEIGRSDLMVAETPGEWSSWVFTAPSASIFAGNCWTQGNEIVYYRSGPPPEGYTGLGNINYYSRQFDGTPTGGAGPRYTNIRLKFLGE